MVLGEAPSPSEVSLLVTLECQLTAPLPPVTNILAPQHPDPRKSAGGSVPQGVGVEGVSVHSLKVSASTA